MYFKNILKKYLQITGSGYRVIHTWQHGRCEIISRKQRVKLSSLHNYTVTFSFILQCSFTMATNHESLLYSLITSEEFSQRKAPEIFKT